MQCIFSITFAYLCFKKKYIYIPISFFLKCFFEIRSIHLAEQAYQNICDSIYDSISFTKATRLIVRNPSRTRKKKQFLRVFNISRISRESTFDKCDSKCVETSEIFKEVNVTRRSTQISI